LSPASRCCAGAPPISPQAVAPISARFLAIDTRTGFIHAALEANEKREVTTNAWESRETADRARRDAEKAAFKRLVGEFERNWPQIVERARTGA
jgi:hypothetical protein